MNWYKSVAMVALGLLIGLAAGGVENTRKTNEKLEQVEVLVRECNSSIHTRYWFPNYNWGLGTMLREQELYGGSP